MCSQGFKISLSGCGILALRTCQLLPYADYRARLNYTDPCEPCTLGTNLYKDLPPTFFHCCQYTSLIMVTSRTSQLLVRPSSERYIQGSSYSVRWLPWHARCYHDNHSENIARTITKYLKICSRNV